MAVYQRVHPSTIIDVSMELGAGPSGHLHDCHAPTPPRRPARGWEEASSHGGSLWNSKEKNVDDPPISGIYTTLDYDYLVGG